MAGTCSAYWIEAAPGFLAILICYIWGQRSAEVEISASTSFSMTSSTLSITTHGRKANRSRRTGAQGQIRHGSARHGWQWDEELKRLDAGAGSICQRQVLQPRSDVCCCAFQRERRRGACTGSAVMCCAALNWRGWRAGVGGSFAVNRELRSRAVGRSVIEKGSSAGLIVTIVFVCSSSANRARLTRAARTKLLRPSRAAA